MGWPVTFISGQLIWKREDVGWLVAFIGPYLAVRMYQMCDSLMELFR